MLAFGMYSLICFISLVNNSIGRNVNVIINVFISYVYLGNLLNIKIYLYIILYSIVYMDFFVLSNIDILDLEDIININGGINSINLFINCVFSYVFYWAFYYMYFDLYIIKFLTYLLIFVLFMNIFLITFDLLFCFICWECIGLLSFFLITYFWFRIITVKAGYKAFFIGKLGDFIMVLFISILGSMICDLCTSVVLLNFFLMDYISTIKILNFLLFTTATKSTQFGLHVWLPDAMEGPIPVSALIHAATLVIIGIIFMIRLEYIILIWFIYSYYTYVWILLIITVILGSFSLNFCLKRCIAFSTIIQISMSFFVGLYVDKTVSILFLCVHMFYKALLFLVCGLLIHIMVGLQDLRRFYIINVWIFWIIKISIFYAIINSLSLCFLPSFYIKEWIFTLFLTFLNNLLELILCILWCICVIYVINIVLLYLIVIKIKVIIFGILTQIDVQDTILIFIIFAICIFFCIGNYSFLFIWEALIFFTFDINVINCFFNLHVDIFIILLTSIFMSNLLIIWGVNMIFPALEITLLIYKIGIYYGILWASLCICFCCGNIYFCLINACFFGVTMGKSWKTTGIIVLFFFF